MKIGFQWTDDCLTGCKCNGNTIRRNEKILDGECNSVRRLETKDGEWRYWCYVDPDQDCPDMQDGWSFKACIINGSIT